MPLLNIAHAFHLGSISNLFGRVIIILSTQKEKKSSEYFPLMESRLADINDWPRNIEKVM